MPRIELLHRKRFVPLADATAAKITANAWSLTIPLTDAVRRMVPRAEDPEAWDGAVFALDGVEAASAVFSGSDPAGITVTVLML